MRLYYRSQRGPAFDECCSAALIGDQKGTRVRRDLAGFTLHSFHRQTLLFVGSHAAPPPLGTIFPHLYALLIVSLVLSLSSRLIMFARQ